MATTIDVSLSTSTWIALGEDEGQVILTAQEYGQLFRCSATQPDSALTRGHNMAKGENVQVELADGDSIWGRGPGVVVVTPATPASPDIAMPDLVAAGIDPDDFTVASFDVGTGIITVTVAGATAPSFNGTYQVSVAALADGPVLAVNGSVDMVPLVAHDGTPNVGETLTMTRTALWFGDEDDGVINVARQWRDTSGAISGATDTSYVVQAGDQGKNVWLREIASNGAGPSASTADSAAAAIPPGLPDLVAATVDPNTMVISEVAAGTITVTIEDSDGFDGTYVISTAALAAGPVLAVNGSVDMVPLVAHDGTPNVGDTLTRDRSALWFGLASNGALTIANQWRNTSGAISGATGTSYVVQAGDQGKNVWLRETVTDGTSHSATADSAVAAIPAAAVPWTPANLATPFQVFHDATLGVTASGTPSRVSLWANQGSHGVQRDAVVSTGQTGGPQVTTFGGLPALLFDADHAMKYDTAVGTFAAIPMNANAFTVFIVFGTVPGNANGRFLLGIGNSSATNVQIYGTTGADVLNVNANRNVNPDLPFALPAGAPSLLPGGIILIKKAAAPTTPRNTTLRVNGTVVNTDIWPTDTGVVEATTINNIGRDLSFTGTGKFGGIILAHGYTLQNVADADCAKIEGWGLHKWGLANLLPAGHTYKSAPPLA